MTHIVMWKESAVFLYSHFKKEINHNMTNFNPWTAQNRKGEPRRSLHGNNFKLNILRTEKEVSGEGRRAQKRTHHLCNLWAALVESTRSKISHTQKWQNWWNTSFPCQKESMKGKSNHGDYPYQPYKRKRVNSRWHLFHLGITQTSRSAGQSAILHPPAGSQGSIV